MFFLCVSSALETCKFLRAFGWKKKSEKKVSAKYSYMGYCRRFQICLLKNISNPKVTKNYTVNTSNCPGEWSGFLVNRLLYSNLICLNCSYYVGNLQNAWTVVRTIFQNIKKTLKSIILCSIFKIIIIIIIILTKSCS